MPASAREDRRPVLSRIDLVAQAFSLAQDLARGALISPEVRFGRLRFEIVEARLLGG